MADDFMFYAKEETLQERVKQPVLKTFYSGRVQENMVTSRAEQRPYLGCLQVAVNKFMTYLGLKDSNTNDLGKKSPR